jgi:hypothetical protein
MKLAGLRKFIGENIGSVTKNVLPGTALSAGFGMLAGGPTAGLTYAATDVLGSLPATILGRYAARNVKNPGVRNAIEGVANVGGSIAGSVLGAELLSGGQQQQIAQQIEQRSVVNDMPLASQIAELSPGTQYQTAGLPSSQPFEDLLSQMPRSSWMQYLSPEDQAMLQGAINLRA